MALAHIIEVSGLKKAYKKVQAVRGIDFYVEQGRLFAFLGPNGAGKSTTIDMLCTLLRPDAGEVEIDGYRLGRQDDKIRSSIGVVFQDSLLDALLSVRENLETRARFYGLSASAARTAAARAAEAADVKDIYDRRYGQLSGGQRRRADIARALVHTPKVLFLDEPSTGLDPQTRQSVWETIQRLQRETGMTVFLTTHYMEEAANADYVVIIDDGLIAASGSPTSLKERYSADYLKIKTSDPATLTALLDARGLSHHREGPRIVVPLAATRNALPIIGACGGLIDSLEIITGTMDDVFITITGKEFRD